MDSKTGKSGASGDEVAAGRDANHVGHAEPARYREPHRPGFHFTPPENWINDPNGLFHDGERFHLFYQYNPYDKVWGSMHWGHAVSADLLHWEHRPIALHAEPDKLGFIFSGSAVVDRDNSSGFGNGALAPFVAVFTHHSRYDVQVQSLAYSNDRGNTWRMYDGNPVIANPGVADFRDPKVFRDRRSGRWVMALAVRDRISFYGSANLKSWAKLSDFRRPAGAGAGVWECPDLFEARVRGTDESRWVLLVSMNPGAPNGGSATQYFVGDFDGRRFTPEHTEALWMDHGPDQYAANTWKIRSAGEERRIVIGWMNNWDYANHLPTAPWRGAMTVPREIGLVRTAAGTRLVAEPVRELQALHGRTVHESAATAIEGPFEPCGGQALPELLDVELALDGRAGAGASLLIRMFNDGGEELLCELDTSGPALTVNRDAAADGMESYTGFARRIAAPLQPWAADSLRLRLLKDRSSIELFQADGPSLATVNYFTEKPLDRLEIGPSRAASRLALGSLTIREIADVWRSGPDS